MADTRLAVLGSPVAHSKSPAIHTAAYAELGLDWQYGRERLEAADLAGFLASRGAEWRGFSLTMPLKEEARRLAGRIDPVAEESGVVNTLLRVDQDQRHCDEHRVQGGWYGFNTDVGGLARAMSRAELDATSTIVIGSGATAVSAVLAARRLGARHIEILARNIAAVGDLVARFGESSGPGDADGLHVSGTPLAQGAHLFDESFSAAASRIDRRIAPPTLVISALPGPAGAELPLPEGITGIPLFDVAYDPWPSPLAARWRAAGGRAVPGTDMLVEQALLQIRIFASGDPDRPLPDEQRVLSAMRAAADVKE